MTINCRVQKTDGTDPPGTIETFLDLPRAGEFITLSRGEFTVEHVLHFAHGAVEGHIEPTINLYVKAGHAHRT